SPPMSEPDAGATPAASPRRHVGHGAVMFAVGPLGNGTAAEVKIRVSRIAARPAANLWGERADLFGGGQAWVGEVGYLGARQGGLFRRRLAEEGSGRPRFGAAVCPDRDRDGGLLDLGNRHRPRGQQAEYNADAAWDVVIARLPASDALRGDAEQPGNMVLCEAERAQHLAELARSCRAQARWAGHGHRTPPGRTARSFSVNLNVRPEPMPTTSARPDLAKGGSRWRR